MCFSMLVNIKISVLHRVLFKSALKCKKLSQKFYFLSV